MSILLEVCVDSAESARNAKLGGADRLEVCSALALGGTTPSSGLIEYCVADLQMPVMMMIRPHDGGFVYSDDDIKVMVAEIEVAKSMGVQGVVFGALQNDPSKRGRLTIHMGQCRTLVEAAAELETTFHRAFDVVADPLAAFESLRSLGVTRLLTSGQATTAVEGAELIRELVSLDSDVNILAGAGVRPENAREVIDLTGVCEIHASASRCAEATNVQSGEVSFGDTRRISDSQLVREIKLCLNS